MISPTSRAAATDLVSRVQRDPNYIELERKRNGLGWTLTILMLAIYFAFILMVAFAKSFLSIHVYGVITLARRAADGLRNS